MQLESGVQFNNQDQIIRLATHIVKQKLESPALFFLESVLPLTTIFHHAGVLLSPFATPFLGRNLTKELLSFIESRQNINLLIEKIELLVKERK